MQHKEIVKQWIDLADMDLALSQHTAKTMRPIPHEIVCFHCQQFTEKYLKAFLISKSIESPYTHDLVKLLCNGTLSPFINLFAINPAIP